MNEEQLILTSLNIAIQTLNLDEFTRILSTCEMPLNNLYETNRCNLFHIIASRAVPDESKALLCLSILIDKYNQKYLEGESKENYVEMINQRTLGDNLTPLMIAVYYHRNVRIIYRELQDDF